MRRIRQDAAQALLHAQGPLLGLIAIIFAIFFFQETGEEEWWYEPFMVVPAEVTTAWQNLRGGGGGGPTDVREFGTLLSYAFLHGSAEHVVYNMLFLWIFAALIAELAGQGWMLAIFGVTAITGGIAHVALNSGGEIPMLGASGAVMGFEGAYLGMAMRWRLPDPHIWPMARPVPPAHLALIAAGGVAIDYFSLIGRSDSMVAYGAHIGGFVGGLVLAALMPGRARGAHPR